jgi:hypothetical protein
VTLSSHLHGTEPRFADDRDRNHGCPQGAPPAYDLHELVQLVRVGPDAALALADEVAWALLGHASGRVELVVPISDRDPLHDHGHGRGEGPDYRSKQELR